MLRTDPAIAEREIRAAGAVPQVPFPGVNRPWLVVHIECGQATSPSLSNVRRRGGVCAPCGARKRGAKRKDDLAAAAVAKMRDYGWETLEPYPGSNVPWLSRHLACGETRRPTLNTVRSKPNSCMNCYRAARGHLTWTEESARAKFAEVGLTPLAPYPGSSTKPWRARHNDCGRVVAPRLANIAHGQGACRECGHEASKSAMKLDPTIAEAIMRRAGLVPVAEYPGVDQPWRCVHTACGREVSPSYTNIKRGQGGCGACGDTRTAQLLRLPEPEARRLMLDRGLSPLEPYPGSARPWRCRHSCGREVTPTLSNARQGHGICRYCNSAFPYDGPAELYLVADREALKIGCAAPGGDRVAAHLRRGWFEVWRLSTTNGDDAYTLEQSVLRCWREQLRAPARYTRIDMPQWGHTETISWDFTYPSEVLAFVETTAEAAKINFTLTTPNWTDERPRTASTAMGARAQRASPHPTSVALFELS